MDYLAHATEAFRSFLGAEVHNLVFVPFAGVTFNWDSYTSNVATFFDSLGYTVSSVHLTGNPIAAVQAADAVLVGGGNTFHLLRELYNTRLLAAIRNEVLKGKPYIGWSAGSNVACPTICTTNDMPIVQPPSFEALNLVPFQINPHYTDAHPQGHQGETRAMRLEEYTTANPAAKVAALPEGTWLHVEDDRISLHGELPLRYMRHAHPTTLHDPGSDVGFLL